MTYHRAMNIGEAVAALKAGKRVARAGWNGKVLSLELHVPEATERMTHPFVFMHLLDGGRIPWLCSQADLLANDWVVVT